MVMQMIPDNGTSLTTNDMPDGSYASNSAVSNACVERSMTPTLKASSALKISVSREKSSGLSAIATGVCIKEIRVVYSN
jgi:hypothetical protein